MKITRPASFIPYGPVGHPNARFLFECEAATKLEADKKMKAFLDNWNWTASPKNTKLFGRATYAEEGYFVLPVSGDQVDDALLASLTVPPMFQPAKAGKMGRLLEDFPCSIPGYYQHYQYEPFTETTPACDHDFGLESVKYVYKVTDTGQVIPFEEYTYPFELANPGHTYLTVTCTRCGSVHGLKEYSK